MGAADPFAVLGEVPRLVLGHWPTPLTPCPRLRQEVGGPLVWLKRDDCSGLALGGNKVRKLEYLVAHAVAEGCTGVVTFGAVQSNHARQTAAACARVGLTCDLVLTAAVDRHDEHYSGSGNVLLDSVLGATVHLVDDPDAAAVRSSELRAAATARGERLLVVPTGGSDAVGTLGYVGAARELTAQLDAVDVAASAPVVVATSTGGTAAGLVLGLGLGRRPDVVVPACVYAPAEVTRERIDELVAAVADRLGAGDAAGGCRPRRVDDAELGEGYGVPTDASRRALELVARTEGVLLDPVYTAKAFALLLRWVADGSLADHDDVVFLHTGGAPGLFAYASDWPAVRGRG